MMSNLLLQINAKAFPIPIWFRYLHFRTRIFGKSADTANVEVEGRDGYKKKCSYDVFHIFRLSVISICKN